jgi:hypothetical protein
LIENAARDSDARRGGPMGWLQILGTLAQAVIQSEGQSANPLGVYGGAARRARSFGSGMIGDTARVTIIPPDPNEEVARAEAETRRMLEEAYSEMIDERVDHGVRRMAERVEQTSAKVIDLESNFHSKLETISRNVEDIQEQTRSLDALQKKVNLLLGAVAVLAGICGYLLYLLMTA